MRCMAARDLARGQAVPRIHILPQRCLVVNGDCFAAPAAAIEGDEDGALPG